MATAKKFSLDDLAKNYGNKNMAQGKLDLLRQLDMPKDTSAKTYKAVIASNPQVLDACFEAMKLDQAAAQWVLNIFQNMLREDASCFSIFEEALKAKNDVYEKFMAVMEAGDESNRTVAAWILTCIIGYLSRFFTDEKAKDPAKKVKDLAKNITDNAGKNELAAVELLTNLLKSDTFRSMLWKESNVQKLFSDLWAGSNLKSKDADILYKILFAIWLLSLDKSILADLKSDHHHVPKKIIDTLRGRPVEKVVRISLTALKSLLADKSVCEDVVEAGGYDAVCNLEFEKWRDEELYEQIKDVAQVIAHYQHEMSNFDRYERELQEAGEKGLKWGFMHTSKFWGENVMKFEKNDFKAVKDLVRLLHPPSNDKELETCAVACHDLGEFVTLHPLGKSTRLKAELNMKPKVMELMQLKGDSDKHREVRREALLCCQKIMLNKWQDIGKAGA